MTIILCIVVWLLIGAVFAAIVDYNWKRYFGNRFGDWSSDWFIIIWTVVWGPFGIAVVAVSCTW